MLKNTNILYFSESKKYVNHYHFNYDFNKVLLKPGEKIIIISQNKEISKKLMRNFEQINLIKTSTSNNSKNSQRNIYFFKGVAK